MSMEQHLVDLERGFWNAAGDPDFYREHLARDAVMVLPMPGGILGRDAIIRSVESAPAWAGFDIEAPRLVQLRGGVYVLAYEASGERTGQPKYRALVSSTYVEEDGAWRLAVHQQSPIDGA